MSVEDSGEDTMTAIPGLRLLSSDTMRASEEPIEASPIVDGEAPASTAVRPSAEDNISKEKLCTVCNKTEPKYKCARCYLPYCSIACSTLHKATHPAIESLPTPDPEPVKPVAANSSARRAGTVAAAGYKGPFERLTESEELQTLFRKYPNLRAQLNGIHEATLRPISEEDLSPEYTNNRAKKREQWTQDRGVQDGVKALSDARRVFGKDGEGVREFSRLVLQIASGDTYIDFAAQIQSELAEENARIISQLLNNER